MRCLCALVFTHLEGRKLRAHDDNSLVHCRVSDSNSVNDRVYLDIDSDGFGYESLEVVMVKQ